MIFKFLIVSDEVEDFQREITIDADATFLDLNNAILEACNYTSDQITSFYTCDEDWQQENQILREEMDDNSSEEDVYLMEETALRDLINDEDDHLVFVFDPLSERMFFMKVTEITPGKNLKKAKCTKSTGKAPNQTVDYEEALKGINLNDQKIMDDDDQDFYGSDGFNEDEFDEEAFEIDENM